MASGAEERAPSLRAPAAGTDPRDVLLRRGNTRDGLHAHTKRSLRWTFGSQGAGFALQLGSIVVLVRLISPEDFGLVAMATTFTLFAAQFLGLGLSQAAVQSDQLTHGQASNLFWINVLVGGLLSGLVAVCAPLIASFYGRDELVDITLVLSTTFVITALGIQHNAILLRHLRFRAVAMRELSARAVGVAAAVFLAAAGAGYWALVANQIVAALVTCAVLWAASPWRPGLPRRRVPMRALLRVGSGFGVSSILQYAARNADNLIIGKALGAEQLGLYTRAYSLFLLPVQQLARPVSHVAQATLCALYTQPERFRRYYLSAITGLAFVGMPAVAFMGVLAPEVIRVALGERWMGVVDVFRILAIAGMVRLISNANGWLYVASGQTWRQARWALWTRPLIISSFFVGLPWGIVGVAAALTTANLLLLPLGLRNATKHTTVSVRDVARACWRPLLLAVSMGALCHVVRVLAAPLGVFAVLGIAATAGVTYYGGVLSLWPRARADVMTLVRRPRGTSSPDREQRDDVHHAVS